MYFPGSKIAALEIHAKNVHGQICRWKSMHEEIVARQVDRTCNPQKWEAEAGRLPQVQSQPGLQNPLSKKSCWGNFGSTSKNFGCASVRT